MITKHITLIKSSILEVTYLMILEAEEINGKVYDILITSRKA